jgi:hypothetical protein
MRASSSESRPEALGRGDFVRVAYRLGRSAATGVLAIHGSRGRAEVLVLRRGNVITGEADALGRMASARLAGLAALTGATWSFDGGTQAYPPGAVGRQLPLTRWARAHLESQLDAHLADRLIRELAGARLAVRPELAPDPATCDDTDRRILAAMSPPRRLDQIWPLARTPRYRLLAFVHFLRAVGALATSGIAAERGAWPAAGRRPAPAPRPVADDRRLAALRLLGIAGDADREAQKRAYRRMARALHPDLHQDLSADRRRELETKLAAVTAAYQQLAAS